MPVPVLRRCVKCKPARYDPNIDDVTLPWALKKDGTCVQCKADMCDKCDPNKPTKCLKCQVGAGSRTATLQRRPRTAAAAASVARGLAEGPHVSCTGLLLLALLPAAACEATVCSYCKQLLLLLLPSSCICLC